MHPTEIIHKAPITSYFKISPTWHKIWHSKLQSGKDYVLTIKIRNLTQYVLGWRIRTKKLSILEYKPVKKASCVAPYEVFDCKIVVSMRQKKAMEHLARKRVDKIQIQGTVLTNELHGHELLNVLIQRTKMQNKERKCYVYQEAYFKCHLLLEPTVPPIVESALKDSATESILGNNIEDQVSFRKSTESRTSFSAGKVESVSVPSSELHSLKQKEKKYEELLEQAMKIMKERDEFQLKLNEQCTLNILMWKQLSSIREDLRKLKRPGYKEERKSENYAQTFFENFPKENLADHEQPKPVSFIMAIGSTLLALIFYMIGKNFRL